MKLEQLKVVRKSLIFSLAILIVAASAFGVPSLAGARASALLNVSYDPTRELYEDYNAASRVREVLEGENG